MSSNLRRSLRSSAVLCLALTSATTAFAAEPGPEPSGAQAGPETTSAPPPETAAPAPAEATPAPASEAIDPYAEAKQRVVRGEELFTQGNYDAALTEFERAHETMAGHPNRFFVLYNIGQCLEKLYRYDGAIEAYRGYLAEGGKNAEDAPAVRAKMEVLEGLLGKVNLEVSFPEGSSKVAYEVWVDGRRIGESLGAFSVPSGTHTVEVRATGYLAEKTEVELPARTERSVKLALRPLAKEYKGLQPTFVYTATGLAVASAIAGGVLGIMALSERSKVDSTLAKGPPDSLLIGAEDKTRIEQLAMGADICFISAGVFAAGAVALGFMTDFGQEEEGEKKTSLTLRPSFAASSTSAFFSLGGSY